MDINLIGVPIYYGCDTKGVENGPDMLRHNGLLNILRKNNTVYDIGNLYVPYISETDKYKDNDSMKYLSVIKDVNSNLSHFLYASLKTNTFPFIIGGDHSIGLGSLNGVSNYFKDDIAIIWVDAHGDINTNVTSPSGNIHGMPLAAAMGIGDSNLTTPFINNFKINPKNVYIFCARDLDPGEVDLINTLNINLWSTNDIHKKGINNVLSEFYNLFNESKINNIHLSFDIDCMDKELVPGTGTPVHDGINIDECKILLSGLFETQKIRSMDFVEFNPSIDNNNLTLSNVIDILNHISNLIK